MIARRELLRRVPALAGLLLAAPARPASTSPAPAFRHGVASGDPTAERVVLWTRVSGGHADVDVDVRWTLAADPELRRVVASGATRARAEDDWTVHVDVAGLAPASTWWYAFEALGQRSPTGRTRTAPGPDDPRELRLGVVACASYAAGYFVAYRHLAQRDLDLVVHLGDTIYESDAGARVRRHDPPADPVTLADYRRRHAQYHTDPDLQALCHRVPLAAVWDDHEVAGNAWEGGAEEHDPSTQGPWEQRRAAALRAYREWTPLRSPDPSNPERIWRSLPLGANGELVLLDTRHDGRDRQVTSDLPDPAASLADPDRRLLSPAQEEWLAGHLREAPGAWRILANQVVLSPLRFQLPPTLGRVASRLGLVVAGTVMNPDQWDGYPAARVRLLEVVAEDEVGPVVVLTGDIHSSWAFDVPARAEPGAPSLAVELVVPSVTSATFAQIVGPDSELVARGLRAVVEDQLPHVRWADLQRHGYVVVGVTPERVQADWWHVDAVDDAAAGEHHGASWAVLAGDPRLRPAAGPLGARPLPAPPAGPPLQPPGGASPPALPLPLRVAGALTLAAGGALVALRRRRRR
ncbi:MAG: alkaline phosphatase D family protein [Actinomycetota bacterium]|nr:alkaline phosphatase D family protein [Actinomycetota bacterium]